MQYTHSEHHNREIGWDRDIYICTLDYPKAFDFSMIKMLDVQIDVENLRIRIHIYWKQGAAIKIENNVDNNELIQQGVRKGCVLLLDLFSLY